MKALTILLLAFTLIGCTPAPEPLFEVTFTDSNFFGIDIPLLEKEQTVYRTKSRPFRTGVMGGTRWTFVDEFGGLGEVKGSRDFELVQIGWIEHTDPRHSKYEE